MEHQTAHRILVALALRFQGDWGSIYETIRQRKPAKVEEVRDQLDHLPCEALTLVDPLYPESLKKIAKPPFVLFYRGDIACIQDMNHCVSYVGSRDSSPYGEKMAKELVSGIAKKGFTIVSGMARGIDGVATKAALDSGGKAVGVLGCGIDLAYPASHQDLYDRLSKEGLLLSEYPPGVKPERDHFPARNRIIAGLSRLTIVGEASLHSGTLLTVGHALDFGRDVACVPYRADEESACNRMIHDGAPIIESVDDVLELLR